jgi:hypothetical protein
MRAILSSEHAELDSSEGLPLLREGAVERIPKGDITPRSTGEGLGKSGRSTEQLGMCLIISRILQFVTDFFIGMY